jgi:hypothetical protein
LIKRNEFVFFITTILLVLLVGNYFSLGLFVIPILSIFIYSIFMFLNRKKKQDITSVMIKMADEFNLYYDSRGFIDGEIDNFKMKLSVLDKNIKRLFILNFKNVYKPSFDYFIKLEDTVSTMKKEFGLEDVLTGDDNFDAKFLIHSGNAEHVVALLEFNVRKELFYLVNSSKSIYLTQTELEIEIDSDRNNIAKHLKSSILRSVQILKMISSDDIKTKLIKNSLYDKNKYTALINFQYLLQIKPVDEMIRKTIDTIFMKGSIEQKIEASSHLGDRGNNFLLELLSKDSLDAYIYSAVIVKTEPFNNNKTHSALQNFFITTRDDILKIQILRNFKHYGNASLSRFLTQQLLVNSNEVKISAADALTTCGTLDAVETLFRVQAGTSENNLARVCNDAIRSIHERYGKQDSGLLSISETEFTEGALSIDSDSGALETPE